MKSRGGRTLFVLAGLGAALAACGVLFLASRPAPAAAKASEQSCSELADHIKARCCGQSHPSCDGQKNAYRKAGCGDPDALCGGEPPPKQCSSPWFPGRAGLCAAPGTCSGDPVSSSDCPSPQLCCLPR